MVYENVSKPVLKQSRQPTKKEAKRRFSSQIHQQKQTYSNWDVLDMPEPLESWSLEDFNDVLHFEHN